MLQNGTASQEGEAPAEQLAAPSQDTFGNVEAPTTQPSPPSEAVAQPAAQASGSSAQTVYAQQLTDFAALVGADNSAQLLAFLDEVLVYERSGTEAKRKLPEVMT